MTEEIKIVIDETIEEVTIQLQEIEQPVHVSITETAGQRGRNLLFSDLTEEEKLLIKGEKGDPFRFSDFTPEQLAALKGVAFRFSDFTTEQLASLSFHFSDFTPEQLAALKGEAFHFSDFTPEQLAALKGAAFKFEDFTIEQLEALQGSKGDMGEAFHFSDFTPEQLAMLKGEKGDAGDLSEESLAILNGIVDQCEANELNSRANAEFILSLLRDAEQETFYNVLAILDSRKIAPVGWSVPTTGDYDILFTRVKQGNITPGAIQGGYLKSSKSSEWDPADQIYQNTYGFDAAGTGIRTEQGAFLYRKTMTYLATISEGSVGIYCYEVNANYVNTFLHEVDKKAGVSVRLVKDSTNLLHGQVGAAVMTDGSVVPTICIGTQEWMMVNLSTKTYRDGTEIPTVTGTEAWAALASGAKCTYNNEETASEKGLIKKSEDLAAFYAQQALTAYTEILTFKATKGDKGDTGDTGATLELQISGGYIQYRPVGTSTWINLLNTSTLVGDKGDKGDTGEKGDTGAAGATLELQVSSGYIQYRPVGGLTWTNLIAVNSLVGAKGDTGATGKGIASTSYDAGTGILTLTFTDATTYQTSDLRDTAVEVNINFLDLTPYVYNAPKALKFTSQESEGTAATLSTALNTNLARYAKLTVTPSVVGLITLKGILL